jgi:hypothetical protein
MEKAFINACKRGANIILADNDAKTATDYAAEYGLIGILELLTK